MAEKYRVKWSREETILAFDLYCKTPFSKIGKSNKDIIELANLLGRTPSSVGLKMANLAHFDPELRARNVSGMTNASRLDAEIFQEFSQDWTELSYQAQQIRAKLQRTTIDQIVEIEDSQDVIEIPAGEYREQMMKTRVGQYFFRMSVLSAYRNRCCITGMALPNILIASHIKPWRDSDEKTERTNPSNGLCLNALHDKAFDKGLITIDKNYCVVNSKLLNDAKMDDESREWLQSYEGQQIILPDRFYPGKQFIEYHNDVVFRGV